MTYLLSPASLTQCYHLTKPEAVETILQNGLEINRSEDYYKTASTVKKFYGLTPIYIGLDNPWLDPFGCEAWDILELDATDLTLAPDLPCLVDLGHAFDSSDQTILIRIEDYDEEYECNDHACSSEAKCISCCQNDLQGISCELTDIDNWEPDDACYRITVEHITNPEFIAACAAVTKTICVLENIEPFRISYLGSYHKPALV